MRLFHYLTIGLLGGLIILLVANWFSSDTAPESPAAAATGATVSAATQPASVTSQRAILEAERQETIARVEKLEKMEVAKQQRERAAAKTPEFRARLQLAKRSAWQEVVEAHRKEFEALRAESAQAPDKYVRCTICDGKGVLDLCVLCENTGKCPTCHGTGKYLDEVCPTCQGSGKCFLCLGSGKMPCPFSQSLTRMKEVIAPDTPDPAVDFPIN
jgi:hypothetical protein